LANLLGGIIRSNLSRIPPNPLITGILIPYSIERNSGYRSRDVLKCWNSNITTDGPSLNNANLPSSNSFINFKAKSLSFSVINGCCYSSLSLNNSPVYSSNSSSSLTSSNSSYSASSVSDSSSVLLPPPSVGGSVSSPTCCSSAQALHLVAPIARVVTAPLLLLLTLLFLWLSDCICFLERVLVFLTVRGLGHRFLHHQ
jgi:hypothetical protein